MQNTRHNELQIYYVQQLVYRTYIQPTQAIIQKHNSR